jgi:hypothetical protein
MKDITRVFFRIIRMIIPLMMIAFLIFQSSCSSTGKIGKGKPGMVPCPCEKRNQRR